MEVGQELLRRYVFIHLEAPGDKLQLMLTMLHKLYALVRRPGSQGRVLCALLRCRVCAGLGGLHMTWRSVQEAWPGCTHPHVWQCMHASCLPSSCRAAR